MLSCQQRKPAKLDNLFGAYRRKRSVEWQLTPQGTLKALILKVQRFLNGFFWKSEKKWKFQKKVTKKWKSEKFPKKWKNVKKSDDLTVWNPQMNDITIWENTKSEQSPSGFDSLIA